MICHFKGPGRPAAALPRPAPPVPASPPPDCTGPLGPVLAGLIGRQVGVLAGDRIYRGKLLSCSPVTLVDAGGQVTVVAARANSVEF